MVTPFVVIVLFPEPENNMREVPATIVMDELSVTLPVKFRLPVVVARDPENPVQLKLLMLVLALRVNVPEPAVILALMFLGNPATKPMLTVRESAPAYVKFTVGIARKVAVVPPVQREEAPLELRLISNVDGSKDPV
jgi:hypothetical protein